LFCAKAVALTVSASAAKVVVIQDVMRRFLVV
jgi:hypothetical protein